MKLTLTIVLAAALALIAAGLMLADRDPATSYTTNQDAWNAYETGEMYLQSFRYAEPRTALERALELDPNLVVAHVAMSELDRRLQFHDACKRHVVIADSLVGTIANDDARLLVQVRLSRTADSRFATDRDSLLALAQDRSPNDLIVLLARVGQANYDGDIAETERIWQHILEINPNYAAAYNFLGYFYLAQGRYDEAETAMRRYAFVAPDLANPHDSLGDVLMTTGRYEEAEAEFRTALAKQPDFYFSLINIGHIYLMRGEVSKANNLLDRVRGELEGTEVVHGLEIRRLQSLFGHRVTGQFTTYAARYLEEFPNSKYVSAVRIWRALVNEENNAALALLDSLVHSYEDTDWYTKSGPERDQVDISAWRYRALAAEGMGNHEAAVAAFRSALELQSDLPPYAKNFDRIHLAWNLTPLGDYDGARRVIRETLAINPRHPEALFVAASIEAAAGETNEARRLLDSLERILERADPGYPVLLDATRLRESLPDPGRI